MQWVRIGEIDLLECEACDGTWIEATAFEHLCADRESQAAVLHTSAKGSEQPAEAALRSERFRYRPCPRCYKLMNRLNFGRLSGTIVDVCRGHGTFLDRGELYRIVTFIQAGGLEKARDAERERLREAERAMRLAAERARREPVETGREWDTTSLHTFLGTLLDRP
jgi:Zn-finger nucleic acid-binding protein